jgi:hypothetical protein
MLIDLSVAATCCSTFSGPMIEAAMPASPLAMGSTARAFPARSQFTHGERAGLF